MRRVTRFQMAGHRTIAMVEFEPLAGVPYKHNYLETFRKLHGQPEGKRLSAYRWLCKTDLYFLLYFGMEMEFINADFRTADWWVRRIRMVEDGPQTDTLDLWFRESGKSSIITVGESIQDILKNPDERIGIFAYNRPLAKAFLRKIKVIFEGSDILRTWFPDILWANPRKDAPKWSEDEGIIVNRRSTPAESTVEAWGMIDSQPTGRHFTKRVYDDVVTRDSVQTPGQTFKVLETFQLSQNLATRGGRKRILGTRYDFGDLYGHLIGQVEKGEINLNIRHFSAREEGPAGWEYNLFTEDELSSKESEMGSFVFAAQMLQNPVHPEDQPFKPEFLRYWTKLSDLDGDVSAYPKYLLGDLAGWDEKGKTVGGDRSAFLVVGISPADSWVILETKMGRYSPTEIIDYLFASHERWHWHSAHIEEEKLSKVLMHFLKPEMAGRGHYITVRGLKHGGRSKDLRIQGLQPRYEAGQIVVNPDLHKELIEEFRQYPRGKYRDGLDALAYALDVVSSRTRRKAPKRRIRPTAFNSRGAW